MTKKATLRHREVRRFVEEECEGNRAEAGRRLGLSRERVRQIMQRAREVGNGERREEPLPQPLTTDRLIRPALSRLKPYIPGKPIEELRRQYGLTDVIKLASNENPLGPSPKALEAMRCAIEDTRLYPDNDCYEFKRALSAHLGFPPEQILTGHGSDELIHNLGLAFLNPRDEVMMPEGPFSQYEFTAELMGATMVCVPKRDFGYDLKAMAARLTPRTKLVFIGNPNNPTGTYVGAAEVERFMAQAPTKTIVVFDEAYVE